MISLFLLFAAVPVFAVSQSSSHDNGQYKSNSVADVSDESWRGVSNENKKVDKVVEKKAAPVQVQATKHQNANTTLERIGAQPREIRITEVQDQKVDAQVSKELRTTAKAVRVLDTKAAKLKEKVHSTISKSIDRVLQDVSRQIQKNDKKIITPAPSAEVIERKFVQPEKEKRIKEIAQQLENKEEQIEQYVEIVVKSSAYGDADAHALDTVLRSSISEVEALVREETGVEVDLSTHSRNVIRKVKKETEEFRKQINSLNSRGGLALYRDTDNDGVSDYDETHIYFTNPQNAFTSGSSLTDGERILFGFNAHSTSTERIAVESPEIAGMVTDAIFEVNKISKAKEKLKFEGRALPNSFVTLYIFSTPIVVTVKANEDGKWEYMLDAQLEDGEHTLYVASVNNAGKILAKSAKVPFTKTAEAIDFTPLEATVTAPTPLNTLQENALIVAVLLFVLFVLIVVLAFGSWRARSLTVG